MSDPIIELEYRFSSGDEAALAKALSALEAELGGQRRPWGIRAGAIDLVTFLEFVIIFVASATFGEILKNYLAGLVGAEKTKKLGEHHQEIILKWLGDVKESLHQLISSVKHRFHEGLRASRFEGMEKPIAIRIGLGQLECYIVLNGQNVSDDALDNLPGAVTKMMQFVAESGLPKDAIALQLCLDPNSNEWRYLLAPSPQAVSKFVDRVIDLSTGQILILHSREEFIKLLGATKTEGIKFLIDPYRYADAR
jgi:hypothetical protein